MTAPWGLGHMHLLPITVEFLNAYPEFGRGVLTDRVVNTVEENIDVAIRIGQSSRQQHDCDPHWFNPSRHTGGSPSYLAARGTPNALSDLHNHDCIGVDVFPARPSGNSGKGVEPR